MRTLPTKPFEIHARFRRSAGRVGQERLRLWRGDDIICIKFKLYSNSTRTVSECERQKKEKETEKGENQAHYDLENLQPLHVSQAVACLFGFFSLPNKMA